MANLSISIVTEATGPLALSHELSEADAQRIFAAMIGMSALVTDPDGTQRPIKLGEALSTRVRAFVNALLADVAQFESQEAVKAALAKVGGPIKIEAA